MATTLIRTITKQELMKKRSEDKSPLTLVSLQGGRAVMGSFGNPLGNVALYDEGAAIKAIASHWAELYEMSPNNVVRPRYIVSDMVEGREKVIGVATETISSKSLAQYIAAREPIVLKKESEDQYQLKLASDQLFESIKKINQKSHSYHGYVFPDNISVEFYYGMISFKLGEPMFATSAAQHNEFAAHDLRRAQDIKRMLEIKELQERGKFLSDVF